MRPSFYLLLAMIVLCAEALIGQTSPPANSPSAGQFPATSPSQQTQSTATPGGKTLPPAVTIEQAIELAKKNNPALNANRTLITQNRAQETTANLRPNPMLSWDTQYLPLFEPSLFSDSNYWETQAQYDVGIGYLFERGRKRQHRLQAAKDVTSVTESQVADAERLTAANAAQQFIAALLAQSNLEFAHTVLDSFDQTVKISEERYNAGAISKADLLKIRLQRLQFQTDVNSAMLARSQALASLRQLMGFDSVPDNYETAGRLMYEPVQAKLENLQARALALRPDLEAAKRSVTAAQSQIDLAKANGKVDFDVSFNYTRLNQSNLGAFYFNVPLPVFNKNQGEIARTQAAFSQSQFQETAAQQAVLTDVKTTYEALRRSEDTVQLFDKGYLQEAQQSLEITQFSYQHGAASLLDFLDAERSYRSTEFTYRQALATYMNALEQLRLAVGTRDVQ